MKITRKFRGFFVASDRDLDVTNQVTSERTRIQMLTKITFVEAMMLWNGISTLMAVLGFSYQLGKQGTNLLCGHPPRTMEDKFTNIFWIAAMHAS